MKHISGLAGPRPTALVHVVELAGSPGYVALPGLGRGAALAVMVLGALLLVALAVTQVRHRRVGMAVVTAVPTLGLLGAIAYLRSLADEPTAIPLAGIGVLLLSLVCLLAGAIALATGPTR